jgi:electron transfer flavoprotein alpha subunit
MSDSPTTSNVLVLVDHVGGRVTKVGTEILTLAANIGDPVALVVGRGSEAAVATVSEFGATSLYLASEDALESHLVVPSVDALVETTKLTNPKAILIASTAEGKEIAGRSAVRLNSGVITDAVAVSPEIVATQSIFGGSFTVTTKVTRGVPIITVRPNSTAPEKKPTTPNKTELPVALSPQAALTTVTEVNEAKSDGRPDLAEATIVVSGGRGVGSADGFKVIEELADSLGAAVGASRAVTDAGWYPHQYQVGQTGRTVSPQLYVANGISGAIQHRAGMQTSKTIVAVNKDPEAPIFELVDFGVVGDLFEVVPQLTAEVKKRQN